MTVQMGEKVPAKCTHHTNVNKCAATKKFPKGAARTYLAALAIAVATMGISNTKSEVERDEKHVL